MASPTSLETDPASGQYRMASSTSLETDPASGQYRTASSGYAPPPLETDPASGYASPPLETDLSSGYPSSPLETYLSSETDPASGQLAPIDFMNPECYKAAEKGEIEIFKNIGKPLNHILTPNKNTVLHVYLTALTKESESESESSPTNFVKAILKICSSLLCQANTKGETPLHIASRYGHVSMVKVLIKHAESLQEDIEDIKIGVTTESLQEDIEDIEIGVTTESLQEDIEIGVTTTVKEMLEMTNEEKDTALHEAVRNDHLAVVKLLIEKGPTFSYSANNIGETPLYIAVERNFKHLAFEILQSCTSPAHGGPLGRTTLHAAVLWRDKEMVEKILEKIPSALIKQPDHKGSTSLHYAAFLGSSYITELLLKNDGALAYMKDEKGRTALHIAAYKKYAWIMEEILSSCPDCCELVDNSGRNALHVVVNSSIDDWENRALRVILDRPSFNHLLNEKDDYGSTPLHCHSKSSQYLEDLMCHDRVDKMAFNKDHLDAYGIALTNSELSDWKFKLIQREIGISIHYALFRRFFRDDIFKRKSKKYEAWTLSKSDFVTMMQTASTVYLVVDGLIATVTFAAGMTMPGGFIGIEGSHQGSAVLTRNTAFRVFVITDTIAMVQSSSAAFISLFMPLLFHEKNPEEFSYLLASMAFCLTISAMGATVLAFVTGTYAVLMHSLDLAIAACVIGLCFFVPAIFISIGCSRYFRKMWEMIMDWLF